MKERRSQSGEARARTYVAVVQERGCAQERNAQHVFAATEAHLGPSHARQPSTPNDDLLMVRIALLAHRRGAFGFTLAAMPFVRKTRTPYHSLSFPSRLVRRSATSRPLLVPRIVLAQHEHALPAGDNPTAAAHAPQGGLCLEGAGALHGSGSSSDGGGRRRQTRYAGGGSTNSGRLARQPETETRGRRCSAKSGEGTRSEAGEEGSHNKEGRGGDKERSRRT